MRAAAARAWSIARKDLQIYYTRGPVIIFGILFPGFLFVAFAWGRDIAPENLVPGLIGIALFFTASAITPAVMPFETRTRTLERLLVAPVTIQTLVGGDVVAASIFGLFLSIIPTLLGIFAVGATLSTPAFLITAVVLSSICFAILGSLFSTPPTDNPSNIMTIANLVRLPMIFISGIFVPVAHLAGWVQVLSLLSPLTYTTELLRAAFGQATLVPPAASVGMLAAFSVVLWVITIRRHRANMPVRLFLQ